MDANMNAVELSAREMALPIGERVEHARAGAQPTHMPKPMPALMQAAQSARRESYWEEMAWFLVAVSTAALLVISLFD